MHPNNNGRLGNYTTTTLETFQEIPHPATTPCGLNREISLVGQGVNQDQRLGNSVRASLYMDILEFQYSFGTATTSRFPIIVRMMIYQTQDQGGSPAACVALSNMVHSLNVAATVDDTASMIAPFRSKNVVVSLEERKFEFNVLYNRVFKFNALGDRNASITGTGAIQDTAVIPRRRVVIRLKLNKRFFYGSAASSAAQNPVFIAFWANADSNFAAGSDSVSVRHSSRLYYYAD